MSLIRISIALLVLLSSSCQSKIDHGPSEINIASNLSLTAYQANKLALLPLSCITQEYPNKLNQVLGDQTYLKSPADLHPVFYGCFDWHSAVHGHWSLVRLLKSFPDMDNAEQAKKMLSENITAEKIMQEIAYFDDKYNSSYERTYGWAWLLKLAEELYTWDDPLAKELASNMQPLTDLIVNKYISFLPKLVYPIRVGEHTNTAFGLSFALDYAHTIGNNELIHTIVSRAEHFYRKDQGCPLTWEPSGFDFLSPCLEEAGLMARILSDAEYKEWVYQFLPQLESTDFNMPTGEVKDRTDGKLVHLDGVNFSRAWNLYAISKKLGGITHLEKLADEHVGYSLPNIVGDSYEGGHWLGSFAIYALSAKGE